MLCLVQIALDIRSFLVIMLLVMLAFGNMFYIIAYRGRLGLSPEIWRGGGGGLGRLLHASPTEPMAAGAAGADSGGDEGPFGDGTPMAAVAEEEDAFAAFASVSETLISVYRLMIGDFEREWFQVRRSPPPSSLPPHALF